MQLPTPNMKTSDSPSKKSWLKNIFSSAEVSPKQMEADAQRDGPDALNNLGVLYLNTHWLHFDESAAARCFRGAAEQGHAMAQNNLGLLYTRGHGVARDLPEAGRWFLKAAAQGDPGAQFHLGTTFHRNSVDPSHADSGECQIEALKWLLLAAAQGYGSAESACGPLILQMTHLQTTESNRRVTDFQSKIAALSGAEPTKS